ncbi:MAG: rhomboid family intramembrane serine protease [Deinococcus sp.]|nr:rhomboid family intramembrane serine protease [Deinococcus sp.]MCL5965266.1 rhomboid family intramembrane serine protease [Deinococcus sp.]
MFPLYDVNRSASRPHVVTLLILLNTLAFVYTFFLGDPERIIARYGFVPAHFFASPFTQWPTIFTSMFLHGNLAHILGNMWFLWVFGDNVEGRLGSGRFALFYLLGGVAAALTQGLLMNGDYPMIGASGAISAVLGGYVLLFPQARIMTFLFFILIGVPAWAYLGYWALLQFYNSLGSFAAGAGVAFFAHLGGFIAGLLSVRSFQPGGPRHY